MKIFLILKILKELFILFFYTIIILFEIKRLLIRELEFRKFL